MRRTDAQHLAPVLIQIRLQLPQPPQPIQPRLNRQLLQRLHDDPESSGLNSDLNRQNPLQQGRRHENITEANRHVAGCNVIGLTGHPDGPRRHIDQHRSPRFPDGASDAARSRSDRQINVQQPRQFPDRDQRAIGGRIGRQRIGDRNPVEINLEQQQIFVRQNRVGNRCPRCAGVWRLDIKNWSLSEGSGTEESVDRYCKGYERCPYLAHGAGIVTLLSCLPGDVSSSRNIISICSPVAGTRRNAILTNRRSISG